MANADKSLKIEVSHDKYHNKGSVAHGTNNWKPGEGKISGKHERWYCNDATRKVGLSGHILLVNVHATMQISLMSTRRMVQVKRAFCAVCKVQDAYWKIAEFK